MRSLSCHFYHKNQTLNLPNSELELLCFWSIVFIVFIDLSSFIFALAIRLCWGVACKLTDEMAIDWSFFLGVWHSVNSLSVSVADWHLPSSSIQSISVSHKNLALHWRQNSYPGITLIFLVYSCWAVWRVITSLPLTLQRCYINTPQHLVSLLSKTLPNTCS